MIPGVHARAMERAERLELVPTTEPLDLSARVDLAKAHCALVFEDRGGKLTDADVVAVSRRWAGGTGQAWSADTDLIAAHLFAWLG